MTFNPHPKPSSRKKEKQMQKDCKIAVNKAVNLKVFAAQGWKCKGCGKMTGLEGHHKKYRSQGGGDNEGNKEGLCRKCHDGKHEK